MQASTFAVVPFLLFRMMLQKERAASLLQGQPHFRPEIVPPEAVPCIFFSFFDPRLKFVFGERSKN